MNDYIEAAWYIASGITLTLQLLVGSIILGIVLGSAMAILRHFKICTGLFNAFISFVRGTPVVLQLSLIYFALPSILSIHLTIISSGICTFGINSSVYIAEILRAGIQGIPKGQFEAAQTLKIPTWYSWKDIIIPQVLHNILPAMINELILVLKETALIATIGGVDIMRASQMISAEKFTYFMPLCIAAMYYYALVLFIEHTAEKLQKRKQYA